MTESTPPTPPQSPQGTPPSAPQGPYTGGPQQSPPPPPPGYPQWQPAPPPAPERKGGGVVTRVAGGLIGTILVTSLLINLYLGIIVIAMNAGPSEAVYLEGEGSERIVILPIEGFIGEDTANFVAAALKTLKEDPPAAIILRVDSGGGGVSAADRIWHEITTYQKEHEDVRWVASFGGIAASGGYYVAAPTDYIFSETTGITGSIGVIAQVFTVDGLMEKIGVTPVTIEATDSPRKDKANNIFRQWDEEDRAVVQNLLDNAYSRFVEVVHNGRSHIDKLSTPTLVKNTVADGRVFTTPEAIEAGLVDEEGFLDAAIEKARALANAPDATITRIDSTSSGGLLGLISANPPGRTAKDEVRDLMVEMTTPRIQYTSPRFSSPME